MTPQFINRALPQTTVVPERFNGDIDADLVPELEAVDDGARRARHPHRHTLDLVLFDAGRHGCARHAHDPNWGDIELRDRRASIHSQPDLPRVLRPKPVEAEGREQADDALGDALRDFCERVVFAGLSVRRRVQAPAEPREMPLTGQAANLLGVQAERLGVLQAENALGSERCWQNNHRVIIAPFTTLWSAFDTLAESPRQCAHRPQRCTQIAATRPPPSSARAIYARIGYIFWATIPC